MSVQILDGGEDGALVYDSVTELPIAGLSKFDSADEADLFLSWWHSECQPKLRNMSPAYIARRRSEWEELRAEVAGV